jgi:predicted amidohydrolase YtcJ
MNCLIAACNVLLFCQADADLILHNGRVVTVNDDFEIAEAMAVRGERILAVGDDGDVLETAGPATVVIDLEGKMVLPGLMDSHVHASGASVYEFDHPIPVMETVADVLTYIGTRAQTLPEGDWIVVDQVFITRLRDQRFPTRAELDSVAPNHPVCFRTGPDSSLNSLALERSGIDRDFQIPEGEPGKIERDENGEPTGILRAANRFVQPRSSASAPTTEEHRAHLKQLLSDYNSVGLTSIAERNADATDLALYESLHAAGELTCRTFLSWSISPSGEWETVRDAVLEAANHPAHERNDWLWLRGVKVFLDGGMLTGSAYMRQPWGVSRIYAIDDPAYQGVLQIEPDRLYEVAKLSLENELQFTAHSVGDGAVHLLIDTYRRINDDFPVREHRPCITHCNFMSEEAIASMSELGIVADLQPAWLWLDGKTLTDHFGDERLTWFQPYDSLFDADVIVGGGSDHMQRIGSLRSVNPYNPWLAMWITLTRQPRNMDGVLHSEQLITREQALRLYTTQNAYVMFCEADRGSLEPGKLADFILIDRDYLDCPLDEIKDIQVQATYVAGKCVSP